MMNRKKTTKLLINTGILLICIYLLYRRIDFVEVIAQTRSVNLLVFVVTLSITVIRTWLMGIRWETLHPSSRPGLTKWSYFRLSMLSSLFNLFMPGALGGDIVKTVYAVKEDKTQKTKQVIAVVVDRTVGLLSILIFGLIALFASHQKLPITLWHVLALFIVSGGLLFALVNNRFISVLERWGSKLKFASKLIGPAVRNWRESIEFYKANTKKLIYSLLLCVPIHLASFIIFYILSQSIGMKIGFLELVFAIAITWLITAVPISFGGMGVREISLVWLLGMFGVPSDQAVTLSMLGYINSIFKSIVALPFLYDFHRFKKHPPDSPKTG